MTQQECYLKLLESLNWLREHKNKREISIVVTELEKVVAYYNMFVLSSNKEDIMSNS